MRIKIIKLPWKRTSKPRRKPKRKMTANQLRGLLIHRCAQRTSLNNMIEGIENKLDKMGEPYHSFNF